MAASLGRSTGMPPVAKTLAVLAAVVVCGFGLAVLWSGSAPARTGTLGRIPALDGADALRFGSSVVLLGLLPLLLLAKTPRQAAWGGSLLAAALLVNVFFGARLWA